VFGNLAELLNSLFFEACNLALTGLSASLPVNQYNNENKAIWNLNFILRCTTNTIYYSTLREDTQILLNRLLEPRQANHTTGYKISRYFYVPTRNYKDYIDALTGVLNDCQNLENSIDLAELKKDLTDEFRKVASASLQAIANLAMPTDYNTKNYSKMLASIQQVSKLRAEMVVSHVNLKI
jgi:hypothetical protein